MKIIEGNLINLAKEGKFDLIVHGCNCFCTMGAGIASQIKEHFPEAYKADLKTESGSREKLGDFSFAFSKEYDLVIVNAYTQHHYSGEGILADYDAIRSVFRKIKEKFPGKRIAYPAIGAGLAGGDWNIICNIIDESLEGEDHTFVKFIK